MKDICYHATYVETSGRYDRNNSNWRTSDPIPVAQGDVIFISASAKTSSSQAKLAFYADATTYTATGYVGMNGTDETYTVPSDGYIRLSRRFDDYNIYAYRVNSMSGYSKKAFKDINELSSEVNSQKTIFTNETELLDSGFGYLSDNDPNLTFMQGYYDSDGDYLDDSTIRITTHMFKLPTGFTIYVNLKDSDFSAVIDEFEYNNGEYTRTRHVLSSLPTVELTGTENDKYYVVGLYNSNGATTTDASKVDVRFYIASLIDNDFVEISVVSSTERVIKFGKYYTILKRTISQNKNADLWNLRGIFYTADGTEVVTQETDIIGPILEVGQSDYMGGIHGNEKYDDMIITCDGSAWDGVNTQTCRNLEIVIKSKLFRVSDGTHVYNRFIRINIQNGKIRIENNNVCVVSNSVLARATNGGLIAVTNDILESVYMNNYLSMTAPTTSVSNGSKQNVSGTLYWTHGSVTVRNIIGHELETYSGRLNVFTSENPIRNKIYLDVIAGGENAISNGQEILGVFEYIFT